MRLIRASINEGHSSDDINAEWRAYTDEMTAWNDNWHWTHASLKIWFGAQAADLYASEINMRFVRLHDQLRALKAARQKGSSKGQAAEDLFDGFPEVVYSFNEQLLAQLQQGRFGTFLDDPLEAQLAR